MAFAIYLNREQFQPEEPQIIDDHLDEDVNFSFARSNSELTFIIISDTI